jgi:hypothetical protein
MNDSTLVLDSVAGPMVGGSKYIYVVTAVAVVIVVVSVIALVRCSNKNVQKIDPQLSTNDRDPNVAEPVALEVLNCIYERQEQPGTFEHIIYFTLQEAADYFRFFIHDELVGEGTFESLDIRYSPPYRRVVFVTSDQPSLPMVVSVESLAGGKLIGRGSLNMTRACYHDNP